MKEQPCFGTGQNKPQGIYRFLRYVVTIDGVPSAMMANKGAAQMAVDSARQHGDRVRLATTDEPFNWRRVFDRLHWGTFYNGVLICATDDRYAAERAVANTIGGDCLHVVDLRTRN